MLILTCLFVLSHCLVYSAHAPTLFILFRFYSKSRCYNIILFFHFTPSFFLLVNQMIYEEKIWVVGYYKHCYVICNFLQRWISPYLFCKKKKEWVLFLLKKNRSSFLALLIVWSLCIKLLIVLSIFIFRPRKRFFKKLMIYCSCQKKKKHATKHVTLLLLWNICINKVYKYYFFFNNKQ